MSAFLERHARSLLFALLLLALGGLASAFTRPVSLFPQVSFPRIAVNLDAGDRAAEQMMLEVTLPVEQAIRRVPGVTGLRSTTSRGSAEISVNFRWGEAMDLKAVEVNAAIGQLLPQLPAGTALQVRRMDPTVFPVIAYSLTSARVPLTELRALAEFRLTPLLAGVPGVARVGVDGGAVPEYQVEADPAALAARGLSLADLNTALAAANDLRVVGRLEDHYRLYLLASGARLRTLADIGNVVVASTGGSVVRLADVARVRAGVVPQWIRVTADGRDAVLLNIFQQPDGNSLAVAREVRDRLARATLPPGVKLTNWYDQSRLTLASSVSVRDAMLIGSGLAALVLLVFLRSWRLTLIALLTVPAVLAATVLALAALNMSFNLMTLGGMAAAVGLVIDDAIVMTEHLVRRRQEGMGVLAAAREFARPLAGSSAATLVIFVPLAFLSGVTGAFFKALAATMAAALFLSFWVSLIAVPLLARWLLGEPGPAGTPPTDVGAPPAGPDRPGPADEARPKPGWSGPTWTGAPRSGAGREQAPPQAGAAVPQAFPRGTGATPSDTALASGPGPRPGAAAPPHPGEIHSRQSPAAPALGRLHRAYVASMRRLLARPAWVLLLIAPLLVAGTLAWRQVGSGFMPVTDEGGFVLDYRAAPGTSLTESDRLLRQVEAILRADPAVATYSRRTGLALGGGLTEANEGDFFVRLTEAARPPLSEVMDRLRGRIEANVPGLQIEMAQLMEDVIGDLTAVPQPIEVKLFGDDPAALGAAARRVAARLETLPGLVDVKNGINPAGDALVITPDPVRTALEGMRPGQVLQAMADALAGQEATRFPTLTRMVGVRTRMPEVARRYEGDLRALPLRAPDGHLFPLARVARLETVSGEAQISRENLERMIAPTARLAGRDLGSAMQDVRRAVASPGVLPAGVRVEYGGLYAQQQQAFADLTRVFAAALALVFLLLVFLYERFRVALAVLALPLLAAAAVFVGLWLTGTELDIAAMMGLTMIVGIVTETAIFYFSAWRDLAGEAAAARSAGTPGALASGTLASGETPSGAVRTGDRARAADALLIAAGLDRARPIAMTTFAAILTLLPLALGLGEGAGMLKPLAIAIIAGISLQLPLVLVVAPALFALIGGRRIARSVAAEPSAPAGG